MANTNSRRVAILGGNRIPFARSDGAYANASNQDIGGAEPGIATLPFIIQEGPHGFIVQHVGEKERAEITREHAPMLKRLCELNSLWCLPKSPAGHSM